MRSIISIITGLALTPITANALTPNPQLGDAQSIASVAEIFMPAEHWQAVEPTQFESAIRQAHLAEHSGGVFHIDTDTDPFSKTLLAVITQEPDARHARFRIRHAHARVTPENRPPSTVNLIEVARFNLGPARRDALIEIHGENHVAPIEQFGTAPDVIWRFITRPLMGQAADIAYAARRTDSLEAKPQCFSYHCHDPDPQHETLRNWPEPEKIQHQPAFSATSAALLQTAQKQLYWIRPNQNEQWRWRELEWSESAAPGESTIEIGIEQNLGQDLATDVVIHSDQLMDHETKAIWQRIIGLESTQPEVFSTQDRELWPPIQP